MLESMSRQIPWGRVLAEGAVIVASILLQYSEGLLEESALLAYGMTQPKVTEPYFEWYWRERYRGYLAPAFVSYFEDLNGY